MSRPRLTYYTTTHTLRGTSTSAEEEYFRGVELDTCSCEYIVYGDFERHAPYSFNTTAYWVTLSKMVEDVKKKKAEAEIEIFEGNLEIIRKGEIEEPPSGSESEGEEDEEELLRYIW